MNESLLALWRSKPEKISSIHSHTQRLDLEDLQKQSLFPPAPQEPKVRQWKHFYLANPFITGHFQITKGHFIYFLKPIPFFLRLIQCISSTDVVRTTINVHCSSEYFVGKLLT